MIDQKPSKIQNPYLRKCFEKKNLITKGIIAAIAFVIVLIPSLTMYFWCLKQNVEEPWGVNKFIYISITNNPGIGFGGLNGNVAAIYSVQTLILLILIAVYIFVCNDRTTMSFVALAIFGGAFNLFQRMAPWTFKGVTYYNCVLDYIKFGFWPSFAIFNFPDTFVVVGTIGFAISFITLTIIKAVKEDKNEKAKQVKKPVTGSSLPPSKPIEKKEQTSSAIDNMYKDIEPKEEGK